MEKVTIDLSKDFTKEDVRKFIASKDDSEPRQLRVSKEGIAFIADGDELKSLDFSNLLFRFDVWSQGNGYSGRIASEDGMYVEEIYNLLKENYPNPKDEFIDY